MTKKLLVLLTVLLAGYAGNASADEPEVLAAEVEAAPEVQDVQESKTKPIIELPQWVKNIKFSGYGMLQ